MKNYKQLAAVAFVLIGASAVYFFGTGTANTQTTAAQTQKKPTPQKEIDKDYPIAVWNDLAQEKNLDDIRQKKNSRFVGSKWVDKTVYESDYEASLITHWQIGLPSLPIKKSSAVITATVKSANAYLCNDNGSVYSEFVIKPDYVLKDNKNSPIKLNEDLAIDRMGGNVQYPNGQIIKYKIQGQGMPRVAERYIFFLNYDDSRDMYLISTAYQVLDGKIIALDGKGASKGSGYNFGEYDGTTEYDFLNQVRGADNVQISNKEEKLP